MNLETMLSSATIKKGDDVADRVKVTQRYLRGILLLILVIFLWSVWRSTQISAVHVVEIDEVQILTPTELCYGEKLVFSYNLHIRGDGVLTRDLTTWNIDPPRTVVYSNARRFIIEEPLDQHLIESYVIPVHYFNHETGLQEVLPPGNYRRYMAITSPYGDGIYDIIHIDFTIREDCYPDV